MKIKESSLFALGIIMFPICNLLGDSLSYYDEIIGIISLCYMVWLILAKKLDRVNIRMIIILVSITLLGIISNVFGGLTNNLFAILVDVLWFWKMFACFFAFEYIASSEGRRKNIINLLVRPAKFGIWIVFLTSIIGQFIDIGVEGNSKLMIGAIKQFGFFWNNEIQTGWLLFCCLLILSAAELPKKRFYKYLLLSFVPMLLTFSSLVLCWALIEILLFGMLREKKKFKIQYIVIIAIGICIFAAEDIVTYFLSESVRMTFIRYGIITANNYFPLGSGFATFGSEMAARYYSPLYTQYGWQNMWGLGKNGIYLNDNFFASIIGQFGWIGFVLYLLMLYLWFREFNTNLLNKFERVSCIATVLTIGVVMTGSASAKSMMGVCTFAVLGIVVGKVKKKIGVR